MKITGIICEYNPFHNGHAKQIDILRQADPESGIVCLMSGNFVQRGMPAIFDKSVRAEAALRYGADLVLELPVTACLSSAEGFASEGVRILSRFCSHLSFGAETPDIDALTNTAEILLSSGFSHKIRQMLTQGCSFPAARQKALEELGGNGALVQSPNNILAIEYIKAILLQNSALHPSPIGRDGNYHSEVPDSENPSATSVRLLIEQKLSWDQYVPDDSVYNGAAVHSLQAGERAILAKLRTMSDCEFEALPYGSEGLWRKLMKNSRTQNDLESILTATKSKRYTRSRLDRMVMCAFLGLTAQQLQTLSPYVRVLALNDKGRQILVKAREAGFFPNIGEKLDHPYQVLENRCDTLYGLFAENGAEAPADRQKRRIFYLDK